MSMKALQVSCLLNRYWSTQHAVELRIVVALVSVLLRLELGLVFRGYESFRMLTVQFVNKPTRGKSSCGLINSLKIHSFYIIFVH